MAISCRDVDRQEGAATVNQEMNLAVALAAVSGDASRALTTQRRRAVLAIGSLPLPTSLALSVIATHHLGHDRCEDASLARALETRIGCAARHTKLRLRQRLSLTPCSAFRAMLLGHDASPGYGFAGANHFPQGASLCLIPYPISG